MKGLPVNIVNLICEWTVDEEIEWYPFFCPKTHKLSWKVNKYSKKLMERGDIIIHNRADSYVIEGRIDIHVGLDGYYDLKYRAIMFEYVDKAFCIYIEADSEKDSLKKGRHIFRSMLTFDAEDEGGILSTMQRNNYDLFLNGTNFGFIYDGWYNYGRDNKIVLLTERY